MSVVACKLYRIETRLKSILSVMRDLQVLGLVEPVLPVLPLESKQFDQHASFVAARMTKYERVIAMIEQTEVTGGEVITLDNDQIATLHQSSGALDVSVDALLDQLQALEALEERCGQVRAEMDRLSLFRGITQPIFAKQELISSRLFLIENEQLARLEVAIRDVDYVEQYALEATATHYIGMIVAPAGQDPVLEKILSNLAQVVIDPSTAAEMGSPQEIYQARVEALKSMQEEIAAVRQSIMNTGRPLLHDLRATFDLLSWEMTSIDSLAFVGVQIGYAGRKDALTEVEKTELEVLKSGNFLLDDEHENQLVHVDGWADPAVLPLIRERMNAIDSTIRVTELGGKDDPDVRSVLRNNFFARPFEMITTLMGTPHPKEIDPSAFAAPFFVLFFGFALGDGGYGMLMMIAVLVALRVKKWDSRAKDVLRLVLYCALSAIFFGALTGGWFGVDVGSVSGQLGELLRSWRKINMQEAIIAILAGSLLIGYVQQMLGLILAVYGKVRQGEVAEGLQGPGTWLLFLSTVALALLAGNVESLSFLAPMMPWIFMLVIVLFAFGQGRKTKNVFLRPIIGLTSLFNVTSYLSNTLSYARLLALGLATGVIASVVNMIAFMAGGSVPYVGWIIIAIILVIGHLFNLAINLLGTFINVARLQLVEFFPQFFEGRGSEFVPMRFKTRYSKLSAELHGRFLYPGLS